MKIKKKEYEKQLQDKYWKGVQAGIKFALSDPEDAERYKDNIEGLRLYAKCAEKVMIKISSAITEVYNKIVR